MEFLKGCMMAYRIEGAVRPNRVPKGKVGKRLRERYENGSFINNDSTREQRRDGQKNREGIDSGSEG